MCDEICGCCGGPGLPGFLIRKEFGGIFWGKSDVFFSPKTNKLIQIEFVGGKTVE